MYRKITKWNGHESKKMCEEFWELEPRSQTRTYILALAEKIYSVMQERGPKLDLDSNEIARGQQILEYFRNGEEERVRAHIESLPKESKLRKYITGIQRRAANMMELRRSISDRNYPWSGKYYNFRYSDIIHNEIFPDVDTNESNFFHSIFPKKQEEHSLTK